MEQSGEGQGRAGVPGLTPGEAWTERAGGNMEKRGEGGRNRGVQDAHANGGPGTGRQRLSGQRGYTLATCFRSLLAQDFPLLLFSVFCKQYLEESGGGEEGGGGKKKRNLHLHNMLCIN